MANQMFFSKILIFHNPLINLKTVLNTNIFSTFEHLTFEVNSMITLT